MSKTERQIAGQFAQMFSGPPEPEENAEAVEADEEEALEAESVEVEAEEAESETEEEESGDEPEGVPAFTVLVDGKEVAVTADEARNGYLRQADYTKKTMELADQRKALAGEFEQTRQERARYSAVLPRLEEALAAMQVQPPDPALATTDAAAYTAKKAMYDQWAAQADAVQAERQRIAQQQAYEQQQATQSYLAQEANALRSTLPDWQNEEYVGQWWPQMVKVGQELGYSPDELNNIADHRAYLALHELARSRANASRGKKKAADAKKTLAPGTAESGDLRNRGLKRQRERARKSGRVEDIAPLIGRALAQQAR